MFSANKIMFRQANVKVCDVWGVQWPLGEFTGLFAERGQPGYETARTGRVFNARHPDRYPAAVLLAADDADLVAGMRWARERGLQVSVQAGGHSWAVWSVRDDALLIDLGELRDMEYHPGTEVAAVRPAVRGGTELAPFLAAHGRAFPGGHCESVGLGGYLLQGGQGWNGRLWGWACENVLGIDAVTADGRLVHADQTENADLYWAARGAGPGFPALVTRFYLRTYPKPSVMVQDTWTFPLESAGPLLDWLHEILPGLHRSVEPVVAATRLPGVPLDDGVRRPSGTVLLLHTTVMADSEAEVAERLAVFDAGPLAGRRLGHVRGLTTIAAENEAQTLQNPVAHRYIVDCTWSDAPAADLAPALHRIWSELPTEHSFSIWYGWRRRGRCRTWRSRWKPTCTWPRTRSTPTRRTTSGTPTGYTAGLTIWPVPGAVCTWGTPTSSGGTTASSPTRRTGAWPRCGRSGTQTACSART